MSFRLKMLLVLVAILVGFNIWRWWPQQEQSAREATASNNVPDAFDLRLAGHEPMDRQTTSITRDLFSPVSTKPAGAASKPVVKKAENKSQTPSQQQQILKKLDEFKLVGILLQEGVKRAFLVREEENFTVTRGDRIDKRYIVDEVTLTSVTLSEAKTHISRKIELE